MTEVEALNALLHEMGIQRTMTIGKHQAANHAHLRAVIARLDETGDLEAADTVVWLLWHHQLDLLRAEWLLRDMQELESALAAVNGEKDAAP